MVPSGGLEHRHCRPLYLRYVERWAEAIVGSPPMIGPPPVVAHHRLHLTCPTLSAFDLPASWRPHTSAPPSIIHKATPCTHPPKFSIPADNHRRSKLARYQFSYMLSLSVGDGNGFQFLSLTVDSQARSASTCILLSVPKVPR